MDPATGALLGVAFRGLLDLVVRAIATNSDFKFQLRLLKTSLELLIPKFSEISEPEMLPKAETLQLHHLLMKGKELVSTCAEIRRWNYYKKHKYRKRIAELNASLQRLLTVDFQVAQSTRILEILVEVIDMNKKLDRMRGLQNNGGGTEIDRLGNLAKPESSMNDIEIGSEFGRPSSGAGSRMRYERRREYERTSEEIIFTHRR